MFLRFNLSKGINSVLLLFLWISNAIATLSATSKVTFIIEEQWVVIMKIDFCVTIRRGHCEACSSDIYWIIFTIKRTTKTWFCMKRYWSYEYHSLKRKINGNVRLFKCVLASP